MLPFFKEKWTWNDYLKQKILKQLYGLHDVLYMLLIK